MVAVRNIVNRGHLALMGGTSQPVIPFPPLKGGGGGGCGGVVWGMWAMLQGGMKTEYLYYLHTAGTFHMELGNYFSPMKALLYSLIMQSLQ